MVACAAVAYPRRKETSLEKNTFEFNGYEELLNRIETINGVRVEKVFFGVVISNGMGYRPACYPLVLTSFPTVCATCLTDS